VPADASLDDCKRAFRQQALRSHPDTAGQASAGDARFIQLSEAYRSLLEDPRLEGQQQQPQWQDVQRGRGGFVRSALRSRTTTLWLCGASLLGGVGIFVGALASHKLLFGKSNYTPQATSRSAVVQAVKRRRTEQALQRNAEAAAKTTSL
jgi:DnaJ-class molecular chaperone